MDTTKGSGRFDDVHLEGYVARYMGPAKVGTFPSWRIFFADGRLAGSVYAMSGVAAIDEFLALDDR